MKPILHSGPGIVIGIPTLGRPVPLGWAISFKGLNPPINFNSVLQIVHGSEVGIARQAIAEVAVEKDSKYLFFLGDDVVVPPHTLRQLIFRMEQDPTIDVVGGVYCAKADPPNPLVFRGNGQGCYWDWKIGEFFEVTGMGMDCTLIRVDALKVLPKPWFKTVDKDEYLDNKNNAEMWTEDLYFFNKLFEHKPKARVFIDATVICEHWDIYGGKKYRLPGDSLPMRQLKITKPKKCVQISASIPMDEAEYEIIKFGEEEYCDYRGHLSSLPFESGTIDRLVVAGQDVKFFDYLAEWFRVMKPGGNLNINLLPWVSKEWVLSKLKDDGYQVNLDGDFLEILAI